MVLDGDPSRSIAEIRKVETVFRAGVGYASRALIEAVRGRIGIW